MKELKLVLLADDDDNDVFLMRQAFADAGISHPLLAVRDGEEAVAYLEGAAGDRDREPSPWPNLLILDLKMPRMNGFDVLAWLQKPGRRRGLIVVVLSASNDESDIQRALALGANAYRVKPSDFHTLISMAEEFRDTWLEVPSPASPKNHEAEVLPPSAG